MSMGVIDWYRIMHLSNVHDNFGDMHFYFIWFVRIENEAQRDKMYNFWFVIYFKFSKDIKAYGCFNYTNSEVRPDRLQSLYIDVCVNV